MSYLQITQLSELLPAVIELAGERLDLLMNDFVSTYVAPLRESLPTDIATVRTFSCVSPLMCL